MIRETFEASQDLIRTNKMVLGKSGAAKTVVEQNGPALTVKIVMKTFQTCGMKCKCCTCCERERDDIIFYCDFTFALHLLANLTLAYNVHVYFVFRNLLSIARRLIHLFYRTSGHFCESRNFTFVLLRTA